MKSIIVFFRDEQARYADEPVFGGKSARELSAQWAQGLGSPVFVLDGNSVPDMRTLFERMQKIVDDEAAGCVIFSYDDLPFLNRPLTDELLNVHAEYKAEYTFADGYPYGFAPVIVDGGTVRILAELAATVYPEVGAKKVSRDGIFDFIKTDINSFEVESVLAPTDWRLFRFSFDCGKKETFTACRELHRLGEFATAEEASAAAAKNPAILKTVPAFYNIQLCDSCRTECTYSPYSACYEQKFGEKPSESARMMQTADAKKLISEAARFSSEAVISLSAWGEPLSHPDFLEIVAEILKYDGLSVFFETDGLAVTDEFCEKLASVLAAAPGRRAQYPAVMAAVTLDAFTDETYKKLHGAEFSLSDAAMAVKKLYQVIPGSVYPQFVRMSTNEAELEPFFRYWKEKTSPSGGELIIQKYDDFAGLLPALKSADLSPLERNVCWHIRRDLTILSDGSVPLCREHVLDGIVGNVFTDGLEAVWKKLDATVAEHMSLCYSKKCRNCDEYYTFNF